MKRELDGCKRCASLFDRHLFIPQYEVEASNAQSSRVLPFLFSPSPLALKKVELDRTGGCEIVDKRDREREKMLFHRWHPSTFGSTYFFFLSLFYGESSIRMKSSLSSQIESTCIRFRRPLYIFKVSLSSFACVHSVHGGFNQCICN